MKTFYRTFFAFTFLAVGLRAFAPPLADVANVAVSETEYESGVVYYGSVPFAAGNLEDSHRTQGMFIGNSNQAATYAYFSCTNVTGTEDINVLLECSNDADTWYTNASWVVRDALSTTAVVDTLSTVVGVGSPMPAFPWMRLVFDGQGSNVATTCSWSSYMKKNGGAPANGTARSIDDD